MERGVSNSVFDTISSISETEELLQYCSVSISEFGTMHAERKVYGHRGCLCKTSILYEQAQFFEFRLNYDLFYINSGWKTIHSGRKVLSEVSLFNLNWKSWLRMTFNCVKKRKQSLQAFVSVQRHPWTWSVGTAKCPESVFSNSFICQ